MQTYRVFRKPDGTNRPLPEIRAVIYQHAQRAHDIHGDQVRLRCDIDQIVSDAIQDIAGTQDVPQVERDAVANGAWNLIEAVLQDAADEEDGDDD